MPALPPRVLVLGLGNDILTDDAVGLRIAEGVRASVADMPDIEVKATMEMGLTLLDEIADRECIVLIDSVQTCEAAPGTIHEIDSLELSRVLTTAPHFLGIGETLALGKMLGLDMPRHTRIFAIEVADPYTLGSAMTPAVEAAVAPAIERAAAQAREFAKGLSMRPGAGNCDPLPTRQTDGLPQDSAGRLSC
jgi:hydrogenase maturation protease